MNRQASGKNVVVCCDGTRAKYGSDDENTNVVRLFERLVPDGPHQISYYDPGVGTRSPIPTPIGRWLANLMVSATGVSVLGSGVQGSIDGAYAYLMDHFENDDTLFLFGYSRGAHTVRELADILHYCGLLTKGSNNLIPYMTEIYKSKDNELMKSFKQHFSRKCRPHFVGVWDTVASVGVTRRRAFSVGKLNPDVRHGYQALALDEKRRHFQPSIWENKNSPDVQTIGQVWFPGYHGDIGGQDTGGDRGISDLTLEWMLQRARDSGLNLKPEWGDGLEPDSSGGIRKSDNIFWRLLGTKTRPIPANTVIHDSVCERTAQDDSYRPPTEK